MTNYQRTAAWLRAAGKAPGNAQDLTLQCGCHFEEVREQLELIRVNKDDWAAVLNRVVADLGSLATALKDGKIVAHIPVHLRAEFLKELCDTEITANGVAFLAGMDKDTADKLVIDSNDAKFVDGKPLLHPNGKIKKPDNWQKPYLKGCV